MKPIKKQVKMLLMRRDFDFLINYCEKDRNFWRELKFSLYDIDKKIRWSAIEAVGRLMARWWVKGDQIKVREYIRNLFWSINDESGGIGWSSPQAIAEIIINIPELIDPYGGMMVAHSLDEPILVKGGLWGIGRLGKRIADSVDFFKEKVLHVFKTDDPETLGLASWAMGEAGYRPTLIFLKKFIERKEKISIYIDGNFIEKTLEEWAKEAIKKIENETCRMD